MKDGLYVQIMKEFVRIRAKTYSHLKDDNEENKKSKRHKKVCHKNKTEINLIQLIRQKHMLPE